MSCSSSMSQRDRPVWSSPRNPKWASKTAAESRDDSGWSILLRPYYLIPDLSHHGNYRFDQPLSLKLNCEKGSATLKEFERNSGLGFAHKAAVVSRPTRPGHQTRPFIVEAKHIDGLLDSSSDAQVE